MNERMTRRGRYMYGVALKQIQENEHKMDRLIECHEELKSIISQIGQIRTAIGKDDNRELKRRLTAVCDEIRVVQRRNKYSVDRSFRFKKPDDHKQMMYNFPSAYRLDDIRRDRNLEAAE